MPHHARKRTKFVGLSGLGSTLKALAASAANASTLVFDDGLEEDPFIARVGLKFRSSRASCRGNQTYQDAGESPTTTPAFVPTPKPTPTRFQPVHRDGMLGRPCLTRFAGPCR